MNVNYDNRDWKVIHGAEFTQNTHRSLVPVQLDGYSCGVMTVMNMHYILIDELPRYPYEHGGLNFVNMRNRIAYVCRINMMSHEEHRAAYPKRISKAPVKP